MSHHPLGETATTPPTSATAFLSRVIAEALPELIARVVAESHRTEQQSVGAIPHHSYPLLCGWYPCADGDCVNVTLVFGSPHGGPVLRLLVTEADPVTEHADRHRLGGLYDTQQAALLNISRPELIKLIADGEAPDTYEVYPDGPGWDGSARLPAREPYTDDVIAKLIQEEAAALAFRRNYGLRDDQPWSDELFDQALADHGYPPLRALPDAPQGSLRASMSEEDVRKLASATPERRRQWRRGNAAHLLGHVITRHADRRCDGCRSWGHG